MLLDELPELLHALVSLPNFRGLTLSEVNPDHASNERESMIKLVEVVASLFSA